MLVGQIIPHRNLFVVYIIIAAGLVMCMLPSVIHIVKKPSRSECIIGFYLKWDKVADPSYVRNSMVLPSGSQRIEALKALMLSLDGSRLYLQFAPDCHKKQQMAASLVSFWRSQGLDIPEFEGINEPIIPSTETIDVQGPFCDN
jgi:hypothetical protein